VLKVFHLDVIIVIECTIETLLGLASQEDGARRLHHVQEVVVMSQLFDEAGVDVVHLLVVLICDGPTTFH